MTCERCPELEHRVQELIEQRDAVMQKADESLALAKRATSCAEREQEANTKLLAHLDGLMFRLLREVGELRGLRGGPNLKPEGRE